MFRKSARHQSNETIKTVDNVSSISAEWCLSMAELAEVERAVAEIAVREQTGMSDKLAVVEYMCNL